MPIDPTSPGPAAGFPTTRWSIILRAGDRASPEWRDHMEVLCRLYWIPVFQSIRRFHGSTSEDAEDLTQKFFLHLIEGTLLESVECEGARFRTYLKAGLTCFLRTHRRDESRIKRGGGVKPLRLDPPGDAARLDPPSNDLRPEEVLDQEWKRAVIQEATRRLLGRYEQEGRQKYSEVFRRYVLADDSESRPTYQTVAQELGLAESDVGNYLAHARRRLKDLFREVVADTVSTPEALDAELTELLGPAAVPRRMDGEAPTPVP